MNERLIARIARELTAENISYGETKVTFSWHDGIITKYTIEKSEMHNLQTSKKMLVVKKKQEEKQEDQESA